MTWPVSQQLARHPMEQTKNIKTRTGVVVTNKMTKTVVVTVSRKVLHPLFKKYYSKSVKFKAHDANSECGIGDRVLLGECRPISREKRWTVLKVIEKGSSL